MTTIADSTATTPAPTAPAATTASSNGLSSDFDTFLTLLTAQIRNQDPLEPSDSTEFVAQLATFSNVEQSVRTNELLEGMTARLDQRDVSSAAEWIGMEVRHRGPIAGDAAAQDLYVDIPAVADKADLVVTDELGREVRRQALNPDAKTLAWPGPAGPLPAGQYTLQVEPQAGDQLLDPIPVSHYGAVREVALTDAGPELILADGTRLSTDQMDTVRAPQ
ncbi:MAG: flagellar hook capping FlgD N-terminal domain-containing protein [Pseudomonadota bacterium]